MGVYSDTDFQVFDELVDVVEVGDRQFLLVFVYSDNQEYRREVVVNFENWSQIEVLEDHYSHKYSLRIRSNMDFILTEENFLEFQKHYDLNEALGLKTGVIETLFITKQIKDK